QELHVGDARAVAQQLETRLHHLADELLLAVELPVRLQAGEQLGEQALSAADAGRFSWQQLGSSSFALGQAPFLREVRPVASLPLASALGYLPARGVATRAAAQPPGRARPDLPRARRADRGRAGGAAGRAARAGM